MKQLKIIDSSAAQESSSSDEFLQTDALSTFEEEYELVRRIKIGDTNALDELIESFQGFVLAIAKQFENKGLTLPELITSGNKGIAQGAAVFDEEKGFSLRTYMTWWIRQAIIQDLENHSKEQ